MAAQPESDEDDSPLPDTIQSKNLPRARVPTVTRLRTRTAPHNAVLTVRRQCCPRISGDIDNAPDHDPLRDL